MDIHYNAFISYRHHPQDIKVAEAIHRGLEHFRVPRALKKNRNTKLRLFRDKEELPISSNLSDDITRALRNSDFLIVICSSHTKESMWVQREIETFLQTHDYSRVLTVLVDGEPYDTIPPMLCSRELVNPVTGVKETVPLEPLSCDWRIPRRKAYREELPRLAAALLNCGYDELRQRQRQYRIRRMVTAGSIACSLVLAFTGYVIYNSIQLQKANEQLTDANVKIQSNLNAALTNQSQYLASASAQNLEEGDRMLAMALALEALPKSDAERPYLPQAEYALSKALWAYTADSQVGGVGKLSCDALIQRFAATDSRDRMFVADQLNTLSVWDLGNYSKLGAVAIPGVLGELIVTPEDRLIFLGLDHVLYCYDADLNLLWKKEDGYEVAATVQRNGVLMETNGNTIVFLDTETGQELYPAAQILLPSDDLNSCYIRFCQEEYDLTKPILLQYSKGSENLQVVSFDLQEKRLGQVATVPQDYTLRTTTYTAQGNVVALAISEDGEWNGKFGQMMTYSPVEIRVMCFSQAGEALWESKLTSYSFSSTHVLRTIENREALFCQVDNLLAIIDETNGTVISTCETGAIPVWTKMDQNAASLLLEDGSMGTYVYDDNTFSSIRYFKENINRGFAGNGAFLNQTNSREILVYKNIRDENWTTIEGDYKPTIAQKAVGDGVMAIWNYDAVCCFDTAQGKHLWTMEKAQGDRFLLLNFSGDAQTLWISNNAKELRKLDVKTGQQQSFPLPETTPDGEPLYYSFATRVTMADHIICSMAEAMNTHVMCLVTFNTQTLETSILPMETADGPITNRLEILTAWGETIYLWNQTNGTVYAANVKTGNAEVDQEGLTARPIIQPLSDGQTCMLAGENRVRFFSKDGTTFAEMELDDANAVSGFRTEEKIYLLTDAGKLCVYDSTGRRLGETAMELYNTFFSNVSNAFDPGDISWNVTDQGELLLNIFRAGNLIHMQTNQLRAWIPNCVAYLPDSDQILTLGKDEATGASKIGAYPCYTTEDVVQMAQEALGTYSLTPEQLEQYGVS